MDQVLQKFTAVISCTSALILNYIEDIAIRDYIYITYSYLNFIFITNIQ